MKFPTEYKALDVQRLSNGEFSIVPIRYTDRIKIMQWRNEQIYHLRQNTPLTIEEQNNYFKTVVEKEFYEKYPGQILFSYLRKDECIGYGGLVHINWNDKNAEISFIMETKKERENFELFWCQYLKLISELAFKVLKLHKIYTYAFDLRPKLYPVLEKSGFYLDARLIEHCLFESKYVDVVIHSKINRKNEFRSQD